MELLRQLKDREAELVIISDRDDALALAQTPLPLPKGVPEWLSPLVTVVPGQIFALGLTLAKGFDPDHPRGLRKVTFIPLVFTSSNTLRTVTVAIDMFVIRPDECCWGAGQPAPVLLAVFFQRYLPRLRRGEKMSHQLSIGLHRPIYLWAGPGTIRMNRLKFMGAPVDEAVHLEAYTDLGARRVAEEAACNWGFPPEQEQEDWEAFRRAVEIYHRHGIRTFGYVQTSNYVYSGSYREKDWYAQDPQGRPFYYYTGRYMACWLHPEWRTHLREMVRLVVEAGADGVFFDNPWMGAGTFLLGGVWLGAAGCYCPRCREAFRRATGLEIPTYIDPLREDVQAYLHWRAGVVNWLNMPAPSSQTQSLAPTTLTLLCAPVTSSWGLTSQPWRTTACLAGKRRRAFWLTMP